MTETVKTSLIKLGEKKTPRKPLPAVAPAAAIGAATGYAKPQTPAAAAGAGGGIASPLTETAYEDREFSAWESVTSSDGIFTIEKRHVLKLTLTDANNASVVIIPKAPAA